MTSILALWTGVLTAVAGPVTGVSIVPESQSTHVLIAVDGEIDFRDFTMEGPSRLVVDLMGARHALPRQDYLDIHRGGVRALRTSQYSPDVVRVVVELDRVVDYEVRVESTGLRIVLENTAAPFEPWASVAVVEPTSGSAPPARPAASSGPRTRGVLPAAQPATQQVPQARRITIAFESTPIADVLFTFADFADRSIVAGQDVEGSVSAVIEDQPWDVALEAILTAQGLVAREMESGIIRVDNITNLNEREAIEPIATRAYRVNFATASELSDAVSNLVTERGSVSVGQGTNTLIVTDIPRVHEAVQGLVDELDVRTPQVMIQAKIVFVNRTDLSEFGIRYELKDSQGNQLNVLAPGAVDTDGDGVIELPDEQVETGTNVVALGGNSISALGNANAAVASPNLTLLTSLLIGRHTLVSFIEALQTLNLSDIQAVPSVTVLDNQTARIQVGEQTPLRVIDAAAGGAAGGGAALPTASVQIQETGIILEATPHVTAGNQILLELTAERSAPQLAESDVGFIFQTQNASTRVLVEDGQTVVIGGLTVTERNEVRSGIPLLMDLPFVGRLFRLTRENTIQRDLIILVTPHIVRDGLN